MTSLLRIDSSSRTAGSRSRQLADQAEAKWRDAHPRGQPVQRHLGRGPLPVLSQETIAGFFSAQETLTSDLPEATALSDQRIDELQTAADVSTAMAGSRLETA